MPLQPSILISLNQFKGTLKNKEACEIVAQAAESVGLRFQCVPLGDGGRGTMEAVRSVQAGEGVAIETVTPWGLPVDAELLCLPNANSPDALYIESSESCGHHLAPPGKRNIMRASTSGLGIQLREASARWPNVKTCYIGLGDSAVSDAGMGLLEALGFRFLDENNKELAGNAENLQHIRKIVPAQKSPLSHWRFVVLSDVTNSLCGPQGSAPTFAPQKGASPAEVEIIAKGMENFATLTEALTGKDIANTPRTGSAGGISAAFFGYFQTELVSGAKYLFNWLGYDDLVAKHDYVVTGEGRTDYQTLAGKSPFEVIQSAGRAGKKVILISGSLGEGYERFKEFPCVVGCYASGSQGSAQEALLTKAREVFQSLKLS